MATSFFTQDACAEEVDAASTSLKNKLAALQCERDAIAKQLSTFSEHLHDLVLAMKVSRMCAKVDVQAPAVVQGPIARLKSTFTVKWDTNAHLGQVEAPEYLLSAVPGSGSNTSSVDVTEIFTAKPDSPKDTACFEKERGHLLKHFQKNVFGYAIANDAELLPSAHARPGTLSFLPFKTNLTKTSEQLELIANVWKFGNWYPSGYLCVCMNCQQRKNCSGITFKLKFLCLQCILKFSENGNVPSVCNDN